MCCDLKISKQQRTTVLPKFQINQPYINQGEANYAPYIGFVSPKKSRDYAPEDLRDAKEKMKMHCQPITSCNNLQAYA